MSKHYICGQYEDAYQPPKLRIWESKESLRAASSPIKAMCTTTANVKSPISSPTKFVVNDKGHLINRSPSSPTSFNTLPEVGYSTKPRWPSTKRSASLPHAGSATFGFKGISHKFILSLHIHISVHFMFSC
jgi:hypothetical protein